MAEREYHQARAQAGGAQNAACNEKLDSLATTVDELRKEVQNFSKDVLSHIAKLEQKISSMSVGNTQSGGDAGAKKQGAAPKKEESKAKKEDDDIDLFGSDSDDEEAEKAREARLKSMAGSAKTKTVIAKSMITLDVKPWDDETDVTEIEKKVRTIAADGLVWGSSKFVEIAFGIKKLQITCVVEDDKIGTDWLEEQICGFEDLVQSMDISSFNKI